MALGMGTVFRKISFLAVFFLVYFPGCIQDRDYRTVYLHSIFFGLHFRRLEQQDKGRPAIEGGCLGQRTMPYHNLPPLV